MIYSSRVVRTTRLVLTPLPVTFTLQTIATICMLLAGKVEETPRPLKDVIIHSYEIIHKKVLADAQIKVSFVVLILQPSLSISSLFISLIRF